MRSLLAFAVLAALGASAGLAPASAAPAAQAQSPEAIANQAAQTLNAYRRSQGLGALAVDGGLNRFAQSWNDGNAAAEKIDHNRGGGMAARAAAAGFGGRVFAENGVRNATLDGAFAWWKGSSIHNSNMLNPNVTRMGFARSVSKSGKVYWALVMMQ